MLRICKPRPDFKRMPCESAAEDHLYRKRMARMGSTAVTGCVPHLKMMVLWQEKNMPLDDLFFFT